MTTLCTISVHKVQQALPSLLDWKAENVRVQEASAVTEQQMMAKKQVQNSTGVLRLLQLFCEGHHLQMQNFLRKQPNSPTQVNIVDELVRFLKEVIAFQMDTTVMHIIIQTFNTLTELCQVCLSGPLQGCPFGARYLVFSFCFFR